MVSSFGAAIVAAEDFAGLTSGITENLAVIIPACLGVLAIMVGVSLIPKLIRRIGRV